MKKILRNTILLLSPFLIMIGINEMIRPSIKEKAYVLRDITAINSAQLIKEKCSWICHNNTSYCKQHHVKLVQAYFDTTDPVYFGVIGMLKSTGDYALANIIFLVILCPLLMFYWFSQSIDMQIQITKNRNNGKTH